MLTLPQLVVQRSWVRDEVLVRSSLDHLTSVQDEDLVTVHHGAQSVGDDDRGPASGGLVQGRHDALLRDRVQAGGCLVKDQDRTVLQDGSGDGHSLLFSSCNQQMINEINSSDEDSNR